jgi:hypothetical protein
MFFSILVKTPCTRYHDLLAMSAGIVAKKLVTCKSKLKIYATSHSAKRQAPSVSRVKIFRSALCALRFAFLPYCQPLDIIIM